MSTTATRHRYSSRIPVKLKGKPATSDVPISAIPLPPPPPASVSDHKPQPKPRFKAPATEHKAKIEAKEACFVDANNNPVLNATETEEQTGREKHPPPVRKISSPMSCGAFFPPAVEVPMDEQEKYPTSFLHGPATLSPSSQDHSHDEEENPDPATKAQYQYGGLVIEEVQSSDHLNLGGGKEEVRSEAHDDIPKLPAKASSMSFKLGHCNHNHATSLFQKMPAIPEDTPEDQSSESLPPIQREEQRLPSFHTVAIARPSSRCVACFNAAKPPLPPPAVKAAAAASVKKKQVSRSRLPKPARTNRTYEEVFLMKKVLEEKGPAALRSFNPETISYSPKDGKLTLQREQKAIFTKVVTKTVTEYEVDEDGRERKVRTKSKTKRKPDVPPTTTTPRRSTTPPPTSIPNKEASRSRSEEAQPSAEPEPKKSKKVTILEEPTSIIIDQSPPPPPPSPPPSPPPVADPEAESQSQEETKVVGSNEPEKVVVLPGHRNPVMELPPVKRPGEESSRELLRSDTEHDHDDEDGEQRVRKKYKGLKILLCRCEDTVRYLTELLTIKEAENRSLTEMIESNSSGQPRPSPPLPRVFSLPAPTSTLNPLFSRASSLASSQSTEPNGNNANPNRPRFDTDEFIQKFFRFCLLCSEDFSSQATDPFEKMQVFRLCVCMRDCLSNQFLYKLKVGFRELQGRYESLMAKKTVDSEVQHVLDSYRRFVRYIYYYMKDSLKVIDKFEEETVPIYCTPQPEERRRKKLKYFHDTTMTINGVQYEGAFIPMKPVSNSNEN